MAAITVDLTHLPLETRRGVLSKLADEEAAQLALAKVEQARIAQMYRNAVGPGTTKNGIGPVSLAMSPWFVSYFRRLHGDKIMQDPQFIEFLKRRGEWFHVPETATKIQVGYQGTPSVKKFSKVYDQNSQASLVGSAGRIH